MYRENCEGWVVLKQQTYRNFTPDNLLNVSLCTHHTSTRKVEEPRREEQYASITCWYWCFEERLFWVNRSGDTNQRCNRAAVCFSPSPCRHTGSVISFPAVLLFSGRLNLRRELKYKAHHCPQEPQSVNIASVLFTVGQWGVFNINNYSCFKKWKHKYAWSCSHG